MRERQPENSYPLNTALRTGREAPTEAAIIMPSSLGTVLLVEDEESIDVLLTDVVMPGMNGLKLAETLVSLDPDLRVIVMSGYPGEDDSDDAARPFLQKPFTTDKLAKAVREVMENKARACPLH